ncbi:hypothetical protein M9H77_01677 [Catharanthus roseus]|uniref:Uncharacterized protein n=1 Tax=Catharanthus roseus TaxID=4058 RepID=A0ACC0C677_CATRO|nr:hypothetical protein M9H77_01677 [Catharanthus roseus]
MDFVIFGSVAFRICSNSSFQWLWLILILFSCLNMSLFLLQDYCFGSRNAVRAFELRWRTVAFLANEPYSVWAQLISSIGLNFGPIADASAHDKALGIFCKIMTSDT